MKQNILWSTLLIGLAIIGVGCGGDSGSKSSKLDFKTSGTYDLSQYLFPTQNQTNLFTEQTYKDSEGNKNYATTPTEISESISRYEVSNTTVTEYDGTAIDSTYTISQHDIIVQSDATPSQFVRYADEGDTVSTFTLTESLDDMNSVLELPTECKLTDHLNAKGTYDSVIKIICISEGPVSLTYNNVDIRGTLSIKAIRYFAKNFGEIESITESCYTLNANNVTTAQCQKVIGTLKSIQ